MSHASLTNTSISQILKSKKLVIPTSLTLTLLLFTFLLNYTNPFTPLTSTFIPSIIGARNESTTVDNGSNRSCDIFNGRWVHDDSYPIYPPGSCPFIDKFSCFDHGRSDLGYLAYRWQPLGCDIPRFDGVKMLEMLRGKRLVFVGDSLNRNMCLSLICALSVHTGITKLEEPKHLYAFNVKDYNCSITNIEAPFLVDRDTQRGTLRLDKIEHKASEYYDADFLMFNTGRWWNPSKAKRGENFFQEGDFVHSKLDLEEAYGKALKTWAKWVDGNVNKNKTRVFFAGISAAHFSGGQWNSGGNCNGETEPITNTTLLTRYPRMMRTLESVISNMSTPVIYLNITQMTGYRKDAHPSIYWQSEADRRPGMHQDCTHWCIPGVPDSWNQLFYVSLLSSSNSSTRTY
ncbi:hypothetical protein RND81_09G074300 [Saponaria officinalis]|uniref:Trichome birefringence-like N-terminal domain-containing protein n=1 Tax=Saponaria officinalis TaxID=3572 RepID=A0AAW1IJ92_SAPOF